MVVGRVYYVFEGIKRKGKGDAMVKPNHSAVWGWEAERVVGRALHQAEAHSGFSQRAPCAVGGKCAGGVEWKKGRQLQNEKTRRAG